MIIKTKIEIFFSFLLPCINYCLYGIIRQYFDKIYLKKLDTFMHSLFRQALFFVHILKLYVKLRCCVNHLDKQIYSTEIDDYATVRI